MSRSGDIFVDNDNDNNNNNDRTNYCTPCACTRGNYQYCIELSIKTLAIESSKLTSVFTQIYRFLVLLGRKQGLLGIGLAPLSLVFVSISFQYLWQAALNARTWRLFGRA